MIKYIILMLFGLSTAWLQACEPASVDWEQFSKNYDLNHDGRYDYSEFARVKDFDPYLWPKDKRFQGKNGHRQLFDFLDRNRDGQLTNEEFGDIHKLFNNPCEGWPWNKSQ